MNTDLSSGWRVPAFGFLMIVILLGPIADGEAAESGKEIFQSRCAACHTIGGGRLVGPDLAGVTSRRNESWLQRQIKEPESLVAENDPIALQLLKEANNMPMPSLGLSDAKVVAIIAFLKNTEQQENTASGLPSQYRPTVLISIGVLIGITLIGLIMGRKKVDVR